MEIAALSSADPTRYFRDRRGFGFTIFLAVVEFAKIMAGEEAHVVPPEMVDESKSTQRDARPEESHALVPVSSQGGLMALPFTESLKELREIRGEAAMALLCTHANRLEIDLRELRAERKEVAKASDEWMRSYYSEKERSAVLTSQLRGVSRIKNLQKYVGALGGIVAGVSIPFLVLGPQGWALGGSILGALLLTAGFWPSNVGETSK
ncbi:MAG TPA: hypothetical protein VNZ64_22230 [Candidatus Acidoferrum sp.]|nr:hypothetical protein [Candidatus Acidoferrum sp.]